VLAVSVVSLLFGALRLAGVKHIAFQAAAHLWVGGLLGACALSFWIDPDWLHAYKPKPFTTPREVKAFGERCGGVAFVLSVLELLCFLFSV
jgi:hypothetical protein